MPQGNMNSFEGIPGSSISGVSLARLNGSVWSDSRCDNIVARSQIWPLVGSFTGSRIKVYMSGSATQTCRVVHELQ